MRGFFRLCFEPVYHVCTLCVDSYSRVLAHYPYVVLAAVSIFAMTCLVVVVTIGDAPNFEDPKLVSTICRHTSVSCTMFMEDEHTLMSE